MSENHTDPKFIATGELSRLVKLLRCLGLDCAYDGSASIRQTILTAIEEQRILLTTFQVAQTRRLKVHHLERLTPEMQLGELESKYNLREHLKPFSVCLLCNLQLVMSDANMAENVPQSVIERQLDIMQCPGCGRNYWKGSHVARMTDRLAKAGFELDTIL